MEWLRRWKDHNQTHAGLEKRMIAKTRAHDLVLFLASMQNFLALHGIISEPSNIVLYALRGPVQLTQVLLCSDPMVYVY